MRNFRLRPVSCSNLRRWAVALFAVLVLLPGIANAIQLPNFSLRRPDCVSVAGLSWHTDYATARDEAQCESKMLLINFTPSGYSQAQCNLEKLLHENDDVRAKLKDYVLVRVSENERSGRFETRPAAKESQTAHRRSRLPAPGPRAGSGHDRLPAQPRALLRPSRHSPAVQIRQVLSLEELRVGGRPRLARRHDHPADHDLGRANSSGKTAEHRRHVSRRTGRTGNQSLGLPGLDRRARPSKLGVGASTWPSLALTP